MKDWYESDAYNDWSGRYKCVEYCFPSLLKQAQWLFHRDNQYILPLSEGNQSPECIGHLTGKPHFHPDHQE